MFGRPRAVLHSDNAKEYVSAAVKEATRMLGTDNHATIPYNPEENGIAERLNRTLMNAVRCVLTEAHLSDSHWPYAARDVILNRTLLVHSLWAVARGAENHGQQPI